jgi:predicted amidohydrolase
MQSSYHTMPEMYWRESQIDSLIQKFPDGHNMDIQFAQSMVFTPCDFAFPTNGIKAEATPNTEMILISEVDVDLLNELHEYGSVRNLKDRRTDLFNLSLQNE